MESVILGMVLGEGYRLERSRRWTVPLLFGPRAAFSADGGRQLRVPGLAGDGRRVAEPSVRPSGIPRFGGSAADGSTVHRVRGLFHHRL